jgi:hypothetical protein
MMKSVCTSNNPVCPVRLSHDCVFRMILLIFCKHNRDKDIYSPQPINRSMPVSKHSLAVTDPSLHLQNPYCTRRQDFSTTTQTTLHHVPNYKIK